MKQGIYFNLSLKSPIDLGLVEQIEFIFVQGDEQLEFVYPSTNAVRRDETNIIDLKWTAEETYFFNPGLINMDSRIKLFGVDTQPETKEMVFDMKRTLFEKDHGVNDHA